MTVLWRETEKEFVRDNWHRLTAEEIGRELGRTRAAVRRQAFIMKLRVTKRERGRRIHRGYWRKNGVVA